MEKSSDNRTMQDTALKKESSEKLTGISNAEQSANAKENGNHNGKSTAGPSGDDGDQNDSHDNSRQLDGESPTQDKSKFDRYLNNIYSPKISAHNFPLQN